MSKALYILLIFCVTHQFAFAQPKESGIITANVFDSTKKALNGVSVQLISMTDKVGNFTLTEIPFGYYRLRLSYVGMQTITLDSIFFRTERFDFNLNDLIMKLKKSESLDEIIVYAEKPLIESKEGNITFNAGESALAAGSNASDLLESVPLVSKDAS